MNYKIDLLDCYATEQSMKPKLKLMTKENLEEVINLTTGMVGFASAKAAKNFSSYMQSLFPNKEMKLPDKQGFWNRIDQFNFEPSGWAFAFPTEKVTVKRMYNFLLENINDSELHIKRAGIDQENGKIWLCACTAFDVIHSYYDWDYNNLYDNYKVNSETKPILSYILEFPWLFSGMVQCPDCCQCGDW